MAYYGRNHYGWNPSSEYRVYQGAEEHRRFDGGQHHHHSPKGKDHVTFKTEYEEVDSRGRMARAETEFALEGINQTVDDEADAFIQQQHRRIELSKLMSMRAA